MPRNSQGTYNLPAGTIVSSGDTILVSQHNPAMSDIAQGLTNSLDRTGTGGMLAPLVMNGNKITGVAAGVDPTDVATVSQIVSGVPVGSVIDYAGATAPTGWLLCGGQSVSRTTYAALFAVIGTVYGSVDSSNFNLPDFRGRVAAGADFSNGGTANRLTTTTMSPNGSTVGATGGVEGVSLTESQLAAHSHTGTTNTTGAHTHSTPTSGGSTLVNSGSDQPVANSGGTGTTGSAGDHSHTLTLNNTGSSAAHPNVQPTLLVNKIIRTGV